MRHYQLILILLVALIVWAQPAAAQSYTLEFSIDIGSDCELSDPNADGDEAFDPGDVYWNDGTAVLPPGKNGQKDDARLFPLGDPRPDPADLTTIVPMDGTAGITSYPYYFDLDGHDQLDFSLMELLPPDQATEPIWEFPSAAVFEPRFLAISYDDDGAPGWPAIDVPVTKPSAAGGIYGMTSARDEVIALDLIPVGGGMYQVVATTPILDEVGVHPNLAPNPDNGDPDDDDVDSLDIVESPDMAPVWLFSADHEAHMGLNPGDIYEDVAGMSVKVIDHAMHLGLNDGVDIDAFEFVWMEIDAGAPKALALLFSVDQDDSLTPGVDESGGLNPNMIYYSFLTGWHAPLFTDELMDDVDALTNWCFPLIDEEEFDWGDADDGMAAPKYPTYAINNGANHVIVAGMFLGNSVDAEPDGQPTVAADGDDNDGNDDEDGVTFVTILTPGNVAQIDVVASQTGLLQAWIDFNQDGDWTDANEQIIVDYGLVPGNNSIFVLIPTLINSGPTYARFRYSTMSNLPSDGPAQDGEVEDYRIFIDTPVDLEDWGDAPDAAAGFLFNYPTLAVSGGAVHQIVPGFFLGAAIDAEGDGQPHLNALGDDMAGAPDDEDGVVFTSMITPGGLATLTVTASQQGLLQTWVDFNTDGDWNDSGEQVFVDLPLNPGPNFLSFSVPASATTGITFLRFRFSSQPGVLVRGWAADGEVEDYEGRIEGDELPQDWGDAPDQPYPTLAPNGAFHFINPAMFLGNSIDGEFNGQPTVAADGDDNDGNDDEDGVNMPAVLFPGSTVNITVVASMPGFLQCWIDFNINGSWGDAIDQVFVDVPVVAGANNLTFNVPFLAAFGPTYARFRYSTVQGLPFFGSAPDGEVEDYHTFIEYTQDELDWGDAPTLGVIPGYPTLASQNGANHLIMPNMMMGANIDAEPDGQPDPNALGDDAGVPDDEDGVVLTSPMFSGGITTVTVTVTATGLLNAWVDFNNNGIWGDMATEQIFVDQPVNPGANLLAFSVPSGTMPGPTFSRWRYSTQAGLWPTGGAPDGEVEDYQNYIEYHEEEFDWGDAPDKPYPTLALNSGAYHMINPGMMLGVKIDGEPDGQPTPGALGDDVLDGNDDEDGVLLPMALFRGTNATVTVTASIPAFLQVWADFDRNGSWAEAGEQVFIDAPVNAGPNVLTFTVPTAATVGPTYMRFRYSTVGGLSFMGGAPDGEVEDYVILITCRGDFDLDGDVDLDDFVILKLNFGTGTTYGQGDADGDGDVDLDDFVILKVNFGC